MKHPLEELISQRIAQAQAEGLFDNLPGAGKPLPPMVDPENALLRKVMKDHGAVPEFVALAQELGRMRDELRSLGDPVSRKALMKDMSMMEARIEMARKGWRG